ncbi:MAG: hypothetical protein ACO25T_05495, partial [Arenimonas sp.]|uniref:hypothetical protein n=1 Tax=Arenimonas sp. TaxID=1872635 RepID=UPI003C097447
MEESIGRSRRDNGVMPSLARKRPAWPRIFLRVGRFLGDNADMIRIPLLDDHGVLREGIKRLLEA